MRQRKSNYWEYRNLDATQASPIDSLPNFEVHLWSIDLDRKPIEISELLELLSPDEVVRARKFHFELDRSRYIAGRGILRKILAAYVGVPANLLCFEYGAHGKPSLPEPDEKQIYFNLSHSREIALLAVANGIDVGVDIEFRNHTIDWEGISAISYSEAEIKFLKRCPAEERATMFYEIWTRKEAYLKARGCGLMSPTNSFSVLPVETVESSWRIHPLEVDRRFSAALVSEGSLSGIQHFSEKGLN